MVRYKRKENCAQCGQPWIIDLEKKTGTCGCGTWKIHLPKGKVDLEVLNELYEPIE